ncbi:hypothetical protein CHRY9390_03201 [Chryseobacterium aquaeductus]|uniref:Glycosyl hydrolase n=1 Tax=Chryseobacterium aquaeductus TaxID=2675056 RepID=A0A9N8MJT8_9FLAO|nr:glycosyl hydrolase [Chryseobacterium aquaeductus]CAA7332478.1 hypothetical protein CHRY9390_03201 [Chryseobacterium potabilaquae]CAD7816597.1 hypothetical protein CHRY9390_03201 [Chryseobacterium aquaeductus]
MTKLLPTLFLFFGSFLLAQKVSFETLLNDKISIRAIEIWDGKVWYSGTDSKFGYVGLKNPKKQKQIKLSDKKLQFRTLAQDKKSFYAINIESPAYFFKVDKKTLNHEVIYTDTVKTAFYDALAFDGENGVALGDPYGKCMNILVTTNSGKDWVTLPCKKEYEIGNEEAAFAASNTNIYLNNKEFWFVTGGKKSRQFYSYNMGEKLFGKELNFVNGTTSTGIYSMDLDSKTRFGIAVGGDYTKQDANINNLATTHNGGETWENQASGKNAGYTTCVKIKPNSKGKEIITVGDRHISYSSDFGKTWKKISDEKGLYVCEWIDNNTVVFAGKDRIVKMNLKP